MQAFLTGCDHRKGVNCLPESSGNALLGRRRTPEGTCRPNWYEGGACPPSIPRQDASYGHDVGTAGAAEAATDDVIKKKNEE